LSLIYEGSDQVRKMKENILVRQYELFKVEEKENIDYISNDDKQTLRS